jgi:hypothetical protein
MVSNGVGDVIGTIRRKNPAGISFGDNYEICGQLIKVWRFQASFLRDHQKQTERK